MKSFSIFSAICFTILFQYFVPILSLENDEDCVFIEDCESVFWMLKNMKNIPNKTEKEVSEILK